MQTATSGVRTWDMEVCSYRGAFTVGGWPSHHTGREIKEYSAHRCVLLHELRLRLFRNSAYARHDVRHETPVSALYLHVRYLTAKCTCRAYCSCVLIWGRGGGGGGGGGE